MLTKGKIMGDQKINLEDLRNRLYRNPPIPFVTNSLGPAIVDMWHVVDQLLTVVEEQEKQIKALEDRLDSKDDQDTEGWAHSEYTG